MPQINVGLIKPGVEERFRYQQAQGLAMEKFDLQKQQLEQQQSQFKQQAEAKRLAQRLDYLTEFAKRQDNIGSAETWNGEGGILDIVGVEGQIDTDRMPEFQKEYDAFDKAAEKGNMSAEQRIDEIEKIVSKYSSVDALQTQLKALEGQKAQLEKQTQIAPQAEAIAQQAWNSGYRDGSKGPDEIADDISGMLARGQKVGDILTSLGIQKPGAGAKTEDVTGQFITDKGFTVGYTNTEGAIAFTRDAQGNVSRVPYDEAKHGKKQITSVNQLTQEDMDILAQGILAGNIRPEAMPSRRSERTKIWTAVMKKNPKFKMTFAEANYKYLTNAGNLKSAGMAKAAMPRVFDLKVKAEALAQRHPRFVNAPLNAIKKEFGSESVVDFESLRNAILTEVNTALSGSSVASDFRIQLELENLGSGRTTKQLNIAVDNLMSALEARQDASYAEFYPWDVVTGKMNMKEWRKTEMDKAEEEYKKAINAKDGQAKLTPEQEAENFLKGQ